VTDLTLFRLYEPDECGKDGYPIVWHRFPCDLCHGLGAADAVEKGSTEVRELRCPACGGKGERGVKDVVRAMADYRCVRCLHPYRAGDKRISARGEWSPCDARCVHFTPIRIEVAGDSTEIEEGEVGPQDYRLDRGVKVEARWRMLTVHHLTGCWGNTTEAKRDMRWWNLAALCQVCHLAIQGKVQMERAFIFEHSEWMKPYAAGWYAWKYEGREITREEAERDLDRLLALERLA